MYLLFWMDMTEEEQMYTLPWLQDVPLKHNVMKNAYIRYGDYHKITLGLVLLTCNCLCINIST